ncbi:MAG TPA: aminodeoxychorismate synthase component I, partial [Paenibacillaceae bacterium]|nr:aminodeoxychorismate synthase component I [Paenibacillaceae bacterium]
AKNNNYEVNYRNGLKEQGTGNPIDALKDKLSYYHIPRLINLPPFAGGAVG